MAGKGHRRLTYGSSRRNDSIPAFWLSCQSDDELEKRRTNPKRRQTLKLRYHIKPHLFDNLTEDITRYSQPAPPPPPEIPAVIPSSPDSFDLLLNEMSVQESIEIPLVAPTDATCKQNGSPLDKPFRLLDLPFNIRKQILKTALKKPEMVAPFYYTGSVELPEHLVTRPNIDISLLLVNKQLHAEAADILYGVNAFHFSQPQVALWWFQHIGPSNVKRIRDAQFITNSFEYTDFHVREERLWQILFTWLATRQKFEKISLSFERWNEEGLHWKGDLERDRVDLARSESVYALCRFRGLSSVEIQAGEFLKDEDAELLSEAMMLKEGAIAPAWAEDQERAPVRPRERIRKVKAKVSSANRHLNMF